MKREVLVKKDCKTPAGRPQIDVVLMFKVIFLLRYYGLGDHRIQYQIIDRTSFCLFLDIHTVAKVPDEKTVQEQTCSEWNLLPPV